MSEPVWIHVAELRGRSDHRYRLEGAVLVIIDKNNGKISVTNDADQVVTDLRVRGLKVDKLLIVYRDSDGHWDAMLTTDGRFSGFLSMDTKDEAVAIERIKSRLERSKS